MSTIAQEISQTSQRLKHCRILLVFATVFSVFLLWLEWFLLPDLQTSHPTLLITVFGGYGLIDFLWFLLFILIYDLVKSNRQQLRSLNAQNIDIRRQYEC
jgi:hypothetical protein